MSISKTYSIAFLLALLTGFKCLAQTDALSEARAYWAHNELDKAADSYKKLYDQNPVSNEIYNEYFDVLLIKKDYKQAEKIADEQKKIFQNNPLPFIDMGRVLLANGKDKKANEEFDKAIQLVNGEDMLTRQVANKFTKIQKNDYAIRTYERARELLRAPFMYTGPLSRLYANKGEIEKAISIMLEGNSGFMVNGTEDTKAGLLEILGNDPKRLQQGQKALINKINEQPENSYYSDLLTWLYTQKDDWEGALIQVIALDERNKEQGGRIMDFATYARKEEQYDIALKSYEEVLAKGNKEPYYVKANNEKLGVQFLQLQNNPSFKKEDADKLAKGYETFLAENDEYNASPTVSDYGKLLALYDNNAQKAIEVLEKALTLPNMSRYLNGQIKLQLGDYNILVGKIWEASLLYSQVDKTFREDMLGEEARFRNAKLAYYRGDFEWAQSQLTVLKASTSELIANDALYLSILITENITPDSNYVPIRRFAHADLLLFQNKDKEAEALLDSITTHFPEHPLRDDILMQKAKLAEKHLEYEKALTLLKEIHDKHGEDVLGDDAVFNTARIYEKYLKKPDDAKKYYEMLILEYPGSTYIQTARNKLNALQAGNPTTP
ncbi:MAG: tetratricopeptide repeat protein [Bacteroidetes bacterium]|nr:tetratricopeptide repeat protein [Bacteroidota bacterium]